jgi:hypothetical protein
MEKQRRLQNSNKKKVNMIKIVIKMLSPRRTKYRKYQRGARREFNPI